MSAINIFPRVTLIGSKEEEAGVLEAARADSDAICYPTHKVERDGEIIGAASIGRVPLLLLWSHSQKVRVRDSLHLKRIYDSIMETRGAPRYFVACNEHSPYHPHMRSLGFKPIWKTVIFEGGV